MDLILLAVSATCVGIAAMSSNLAVNVISGLPLSVYLPGAALISFLDPLRQHARGGERQIWIVGASFGSTIVGGIVLNLVGGLSRTSWLIWTCTVIFLGVGIKLLLPHWPYQSDAELPNIDTAETDDWDYPKVSSGVLAHTRHWLGSLGVSMRQAIFLFSAIVICAASFALSVYTNAATTQERFVQAWVLPRPTYDVFSNSVEVGLQSHLGNQNTFLVRVDIGRGPAKTFTVTLADGGSWTRVLTRRPGEQVETTVSIASQPSVILTSVNLATPVK